MLNNCLFFNKPVMMNSKYPALIVIPQIFRKQIFDHYHSGPTGRHMGEYKALYRMRSRFYWPKIRDDIKTWVQSCAHCFVSQERRNITLCGRSFTYGKKSRNVCQVPYFGWYIYEYPIYLKNLNSPEGFQSLTPYVFC